MQHLFNDNNPIRSDYENDFFVIIFYDHDGIVGNAEEYESESEFD